MSNNDSVNLNNLATKSTPTTSDLVFLSDASSGLLVKQATIGSLPLPSGQIVPTNSVFLFKLLMGIPGMFSSGASNTQTQSQGVLLNSNVVFIPFLSSIPFTVSTATIFVVTGLAASSVTIGIYSAGVGGSQNNYPATNTALRTGTASTASSGVTVPINFTSLTITANLLYYLAIQLSSAVTLSLTNIQLNAGNPNPMSQIAASSSWSPLIFTYTNVYSAGVMPSIISSSVNRTQATYLPYVVLS